MLIATKIAFNEKTSTKNPLNTIEIGMATWAMVNTKY